MMETGMSSGADRLARLLASRLEIAELRDLLEGLNGGAEDLAAAVTIHLGGASRRDDAAAGDALRAAEDLVRQLHAVAGEGELRRLYTLMASWPKEVVKALRRCLVDGGRSEETPGEVTEWLLDAYAGKPAANLASIALVAITTLASGAELKRIEENCSEGSSIRASVTRLEAELFALAPRILRAKIRRAEVV